MDQILLVIGASIFGTLGTVHLLYTFFSNKFHAHDSSVTKAMKSATPVITKQTTMWDAWIGFNASHSLGAMLLAAIYIPLSLFHFSVIQQSIWFSTLPVIVGLSYLFLAKKYWFNIPFFGILIATISFIVAALPVI